LRRIAAPRPSWEEVPSMFGSARALFPNIAATRAVEGLVRA
jgi:hypothetical protein